VSAVLVDLCLAVAVLAAWLGCFGAIRMRSALDRLHAVTFVNAACGPLVAAAAFLADGISPRSVKVACIVAFILATGSAVSHAAGRALMLRDGPQA
jgi:multicomponent Na+:H+ antiporter subunit G